MPAQAGIQYPADFVDLFELDPGLYVTPEGGNPGRGDGLFFDTLLGSAPCPHNAKSPASTPLAYR